MTARRLGWIGGGLVVLGLVLMLIGSVALGATGFGPGSFMGPGMMGPSMMNPGMMGLGPGPTAPTGTSVRMAGTRFEPSMLTTGAGEPVRWFNDDALPHTVTAADGSWDSGNLPPGGLFEHRFEAPGTYQYVCRYHPGMAGTITVTS